MPDFRKDPIVGRWVIVAESRAQRPQEFRGVSRVESEAPCPFCEGHEQETPGELAVLRAHGTAPNAPGWQIRVVPNKYPALERAGGSQPSRDGWYESLPGIGTHEVIVESPRHLLRCAQLSDERLADVFWIYRDRLVELKRDPRLVYGLVFKNVGAAAGASLEHLHSQLIALPMVPATVQEEISGSAALYGQRGCCPYCEIIEHELVSGQRTVLDTAGFIAFCPFASRFPFETWIVPKAHASHYEATSRGTVDELARVVRKTIAKIEAAIDQPAYNYIIHTSPFDSRELAHYHWHIEIIPRSTEMAGFEWGTGCHINPVSPERAASFLREFDVEVSQAKAARARETG